MEINFTDIETQELEALAVARNNKIGLESDNNSLYLHRIGVYSEAAVAKAFNGSFNREIYPTGGDNGEPDVIIPEVGSVEVKAVGKYGTRPWLKIEVAKYNPSVDYYVVVAVDFTTKTVSLLGWTDRETVIAQTPERCGEADKYPLNYIVKRLKMMKTFPTSATSEVIPSTAKSIESSDDVIYAIPASRAKKTAEEIKARVLEVPVVVKSGFVPGQLVRLKGIEGPTLVISRALKAESGVSLLECVYYNGTDLKISLLPKEALLMV